MKYLFSILLVVFTLNLKANFSVDTLKNKNFTITPSVTFTNLHTWRGLTAGTAPAIEPNVRWQYKNLAFDTWAGYTFDNSFKEIDFVLTYSYKFLTISVSDFYCMPKVVTNKFTSLKNDETDHLFETKTSFRLSEKVPITLSGAFFFAGSDIEKTETEVKQLYSSYFEIFYPFTIANTPVSLEIGGTPAKGLYAKEASVYNYSLSVYKDFKISKQFNLATKYKLVYNLDKNTMNFSVVFTFNA